MSGSLALRGFAFLAALAVAAGSYAASPRDRRFRSARHGVTVEVPPGWTLSQHTGFPTILVLLLHPDGSRISVSAALTPARDSQSLVDQNRRGMQAQKLAITKQLAGPRGGVLVDARATDRDEMVRQLYLVRPFGETNRQAIVVTLVTRGDHLATASVGFEWTLAHLALESSSGQADEGSDGTRRRDEESSAGGHAAGKDRR